jgi:flagellar hook protein FlgE
MGLSSVLSTALTGLNTAETTIDVVGNNVANASTVGFKASEALFATQFLQTQSLGSAPTGSSGGTNPRQIGLGAQTAEISPDFTQGTIEISANASDLAIQGDGFFIVEGDSGETLYTRNGIFKTNADNELVTTTGQRVLGYGVDQNFQLDSTTLQALEIPIGSAAVAQATQNVFLEGNLAPAGDVATTAEILTTGVLGDGSFTAPAAGATAAIASTPNAGTTTLTGNAGAGSLTATGTYQYRIVFADGPVGSVEDTEGSLSVELGPLTLGAGENEIVLNNIPVDGAGSYETRRIYRTTDGGSTYQFVDEIPDNTTTTFTDGVADGSLGAALNTNTLTGNYSYYVVYADASGGPGFGNESRPSAVVGPVNVVGGRVQIDDLPVDGTGHYTVRRLYRSLATDTGSFHYVGEIPDMAAGRSFTDSIPDSVIEGNAELNLDGPRISTNTLLVDVISRDGSNYNQVFEEGTLSFTSRKGGDGNQKRVLTTKEMEITSTSTVLDLINFMDEAWGIRSIPGPDPVNPIPNDINGSNPGGSVTANGEIRFVGNNGVDNAIEVRGTDLSLTNSSGLANVDLSFSSVQDAVGESAVADFVVYDSLGIPVNVRVTTVLESQSSTQAVYRWFADSPDNDPASGVDVAVGTGLIVFDSTGNVSSVTDTTVAIDRRNISSVSPLAFDLDFSTMKGLGSENSTMNATRQDGFEPGQLTSFIIGEDGRITGVFSNGVSRDLGQLRLASFANPAGLEQKGQNLYGAGINSGLPVQGNPGQQGIGTIIAGAVELSNTDIGGNLIDLILASTQYRGNTRVISSAQQLLDELLNLRR